MLFFIIKFVDMVYNYYMNDIKKLLGRRIKELRVKQNLSQEQLAELVNLDRRSISNIECGNTFPSSSLSNIAVALKTDLKNLFDFECCCKSKDEVIDYINTKLPDLSIEQLKIIYRLIEVM